MFSHFVRLRTSTLSFVDALCRATARSWHVRRRIAISPHLTGQGGAQAGHRQRAVPMGGTPIWNALDAALTALASSPAARGPDDHRRGTCAAFPVPGSQEMSSGAPCAKASCSARSAWMAQDSTTRSWRWPRKPAVATSRCQRSGPHGDFRARRRGLRRQYLIGFSPAVLDGKLHRVEVRVGRPGMKVKARRNYLAGRS